MQLGLELGILPLFDQSRKQEVAGIQMERRVADLQCSPIWFEHQSLAVHEGNEGCASTLEKARNNGDWLHRRLPVDGSYQRDVDGVEEHHRTRYETFLGLIFRHDEWTGEYSTRQVGYIEGIASTDHQEFNTVSKNYGQDRWENSLPFSSLQSSTYLHSEIVQTSGCSQQSKMGVGPSVGINTTSEERCTVASGQLGSIQWQECMEALASGSAEYRCIDDRMGSNIESERTSRRKLDIQLGKEREESAYFQKGVDGSVSWSEDVPEGVARKISDSSSRQQECAKLYGEWWRQSTGYGSTSQEDLGLDSDVGHFNLQDRISSIRGKLDSRSGEQNDGSQHFSVMIVYFHLNIFFNADTADASFPWSFVGVEE